MNLFDHEQNRYRTFEELSQDEPITPDEMIELSEMPWGQGWHAITLWNIHRYPRDVVLKTIRPIEGHWSTLDEAKAALDARFKDRFRIEWNDNMGTIVPIETPG